MQIFVIALLYLLGYRLSMNGQLDSYRDDFL